MSILERILEELSKTEKKEADLCKYVGINQNNFTNWKRRGTEPPATLLPLFAEFLNVSVDYLITGEEKEQYYLDPEAAALAQEIFDNPNLKILFDATRDVSKEDLEMVVQIAQRLLEK